MIARLSLRHRCAICCRADRAGCRSVSPGAESQGGPSHRKSPASLLIAKQIVEIKGVKAMFAPLVRGVIKKTKESVMQTNMMWAKDINESPAKSHKDYDAAPTEDRRRNGAALREPFHRGGTQADPGLLPIAGRSENAGRGAEGARRKHVLCRKLGRQSFHRSHE